MDREDEVTVLRGRSPKRRLKNIRPREVSLVDEAANQRQFITVKNKGESPAKKPEEIFKSQEPAAPEQTENVEKLLSPEMKEQITGVLASATETMMAITQMVGDLPEDGILPSEAITMMANIGQVLVETSSQVAQSYSDDEMAQKSFKNSLTVLEKAGKKMSGARLEKFQSALSALEELLKELAGEHGDEPEKSMVKDRKVSKNEGGTTVDKDKEKVQKSTGAEASQSPEKPQETQSESAPASEPAAEPAPAAAPAEAAPAAAEGVEAAIEKAMKPFGEKLEKVSKALEASETENKKLKEKIETLEKSASPSNSESDEGDSGDKGTEVNKGKNIWGGLFS